ncbi:MAG: NAD(P)-dependent oxidoreductase [Dehalococcoidia bacterium]
MEQSKRTVLVTGGAGYLAGQLLPEFAERYSLRLVDVVARPATDTSPEVFAADMTDPDTSTFRHHFDGVDTVIHLAYKNPGGVWGDAVPPFERFPIEMQNIQMAYNVLQCAYEAGARRVLLASSNATTSWTEQNRIHTRKQDMIHPEAAPYSATFYGWAKISYEQLGFLFANGNIGRQLQVVSMRIGAPRPIPVESYNGDMRRYKRDLGAYVSPRDLRQFMVKAIETENIENEDGIPYLPVYGVSDNTRRFWALESARRVLGFEPEDDSEVIWADDIAHALTQPDGEASPGRVGHTPPHA